MESNLRRELGNVRLILGSVAALILLTNELGLRPLAFVLFGVLIVLSVVLGGKSVLRLRGRS